MEGTLAELDIGGANLGESEKSSVITSLAQGGVDEFELGAPSRRDHRGNTWLHVRALSDNVQAIRAAKC